MERILTSVSLTSNVSTSELLYEAGRREGVASGAFAGLSAKTWASTSLVCLGMFIVSPWIFSARPGDSQGRNSRVAHQIGASRDKSDSNEDSEANQKKKNSDSKSDNSGNSNSGDSDPQLVEHGDEPSPRQPGTTFPETNSNGIDVRLARFGGVDLYDLDDRMRHRHWRDLLRERPPTHSSITEVHSVGATSFENRWTGVAKSLLDEDIGLD
jgi:hypothetical protein